MNNSFKVDEATDAVKTMIESKAVRSTAAVPYAEQLETDSEQSLFENQLSRSCTAVRTVDVGSDDERIKWLVPAVHSPWRGVEISSLSSPHVNMSISNHSTTRKSWRSDAPIILPGWECHTGGFPVKTHSTPVPSKDGRLWVAHKDSR